MAYSTAANNDNLFHHKHGSSKNNKYNWNINKYTDYKYRLL